MRCPFCNSEDTQVKDSRQAEDGSAVRRRRLCGSCGGRFTTFERVQLREMISGVVRQLESSGNSDITSDDIGALVMEGLAGLDSR